MKCDVFSGTPHKAVLLMPIQKCLSTIGVITQVSSRNFEMPQIGNSLYRLTIGSIIVVVEEFTAIYPWSTLLNALEAPASLYDYASCGRLTFLGVIEL